MIRKTIIFSTILATIVTLFVGNNVLQNLGYMIGQENAPTYQKLHPAFILVVLTLSMYVLKLRHKVKFLKEKKIEIIFVAYFLILIWYMQISNLSGALSFIPNTLLLPIFFSLILNSSDHNLNSKIKYVLISFLIVNSSIALIERLYTFHIFHPISWKEIGYSTFRSTALQNHPLNNALITSTIMSFVLISRIKPVAKYTIFFLGLASIVSFGTRSSLLAWIAMLSLFLCHSFLFTTAKSRIERLLKPLGLLLILIGVGLITLLITNSSFGQRLMERAYLDDSANARIEVFRIFQIIQSSDLLWGASGNTTLYLQSAAGVPIIENFWIIWIIRFGVIFFIPLTIIFVRFLFSLVKNYSRFQRLFVFVTFLGIASTNNSLGSVTSAISVYVLCSYAFSENKVGGKFKLKQTYNKSILTLNK